LDGLTDDYKEIAVAETSDFAERDDAIDRSGYSLSIPEHRLSIISRYGQRVGD